MRKTKPLAAEELLAVERKKTLALAGACGGLVGLVEILLDNQRRGVLACPKAEGKVREQLEKHRRKIARVFGVKVEDLNGKN